MDKGILELEQRMGLSSGFFEKLIQEDDWSFIIKLHALFEGACTHLLLFHFQEPTLFEVLSRLELSNKSTGKLAFLDRLELLGKGDRRFISSLSEIRNTLVHDVTNHTFSLKEMLSAYSGAQLKNFTIAFNPWEENIREMIREPAFNNSLQKQLIDGTNLGRRMEDAREDPKEFIWLGAHNVLVSIADMHGFSDYKQWTKAKSLLFEDDKDDA